MTDEQEIAALAIEPPPEPKLTRKEKIRYVVATVLGIAGVAGLVLGIVLAVISPTASCVNSNLGQRNKPSAADAAAHIAAARDQLVWVDSLASVLTAPKAAQATDYAAFLTELTTYGAQLTTYISSLTTDQDTRNAHPLGHC